jgi:hypothetical protein
MQGPSANIAAEINRALQSVVATLPVQHVTLEMESGTYIPSDSPYCKRPSAVAISASPTPASGARFPAFKSEHVRNDRAKSPNCTPSI